MLRSREEGYWDWGVGVGRREGEFGKGSLSNLQCKTTKLPLLGGAGACGVLGLGSGEEGGGDLGKGAYQIYSVR